MFTLDLDPFQLVLLSSDHEILDQIESEYGKNTMKPLAFEILKQTKEKYENIGKDVNNLKYEKYLKMLN